MLSHTPLHTAAVCVGQSCVPVFGVVLAQDVLLCAGGVAAVHDVHDVYVDRDRTTTCGGGAAHVHEGERISPQCVERQCGEAVPYRMW